MSAPKIFYLNLKHVHKYGCAKFQPNPLFSSQQTTTESAAEEQKKKEPQKKKKKVGKPIGDPVGGQDAPINLIAKQQCYLTLPVGDKSYDA